MSSLLGRKETCSKVGVVGAVVAVEAGEAGSLICVGDRDGVVRGLQPGKGLILRRRGGKEAAGADDEAGAGEGSMSCLELSCGYLRQSPSGPNNLDRLVEMAKVKTRGKKVLSRAVLDSIEVWQRGLSTRSPLPEL